MTIKHYHFKAVSLQGACHQGTQPAASREELQQLLSSQGLQLVHARTSLTTWLRQPAVRVPRRELLRFFINLEQLHQAGVPLIDSLQELRQITDHQGLVPVIEQIQQQIQAGQSLARALQQHPSIFNQTLCSLIYVGEESGQLEAVLNHIVCSLQWQDELAAHTRNMLLYPAFVAVSVLTVSLFLLLYLVPQMVTLLQKTGVALPGHTQSLLMLSQLIQQYGGLFLGLLIAMSILIQTFSRRSTAFRTLHDRVLLKLWLIGPLWQKILLARFSHAFALMYRSGLDILSCLHNGRHVINNQAMQQALTQIRQDIEAGQSLSTSFARTRLFPSLVIRMLTVGESTGSLDQTWLNISYFYQRDIQDAVKRLQSLAEPVLTVLLGLLLAWIMLAVLSPMYQIIQNIPL